MKKNWFNIAVLAVVVIAVGVIVFLKVSKPVDEVIMPEKGECTVVYIGGTLCRPCELLKPVFKQMKVDFEGRATLVDMLLNSDNKNAYKIDMIPTIMVFDNNASEVTRKIVSEEEVNGVPDWIDGVLKGLGR